MNCSTANRKGIIMKRNVDFEHESVNKLIKILVCKYLESEV